MIQVELERAIDRIDSILDKNRLNSTQEDNLLAVRAVIMQHLLSNTYKSKELEKAMKRLKRFI